MAGYDRDQLNTIRTIRQVAQQRYGNDPAKLRRYLLTNYEIGDVESSFHNLKGGDADSEGYRQERASIYKDPTNLKASINRAFDEMEQHDHGQSTGELAADVQRPAAQYRGKYQVALPTARALAADVGESNSSSASRVVKGTAPTLHKGTTTVDAQGAVSAALLDPRKKMSLASRILENVQSGKYTTTTAPKATAGTPAKYSVASANATVSTHAKPGSPTAAGTSEGGLHDTAGLAGYPAHDYFAPAGSHAVAPVSGTVVRLSGNDPKNGPTDGPHGPLGWSVYIKGADGKEYFLTHMGSRDVKVGEKLKQGQVIGTVANYDKYGTPSHIHMGVSG